MCIAGAIHVAPEVVRVDLGRIRPFDAPLVLPYDAARIAHRTDGRVAVPAPTGEQDQTRGVQPAQPGQEGDRMPEDRTILGLVQQAQMATQAWLRSRRIIALVL